MRTITLILPYYENREMFQHQQTIWERWPAELKRKTEVIVVDDCSPTWPGIESARSVEGLDFKLYRLAIDLPWNWIACRNIGAHHAEGEWLLMTDMDHIVTDELLAYLHSFDADPDKIYYPARVDGPEKNPNPKPHPNSYFMTREMFWRVGGYDENYSGHYGTDGIWRRRCEAVAGERELIPVPLVQYLPNHIVDCRSSLERKSETQRQAVLDISAKGLPVKTLSFPYERIL